MKQRTDFYCVIQADGAFCTWSLHHNRRGCWRNFLQGLGYDMDDRAKRSQYQKEGNRCVKVRLTLAEEGKGK